MKIPSAAPAKTMGYPRPFWDADGQGKSLRGEFEIRLRELILSFREDPATSMEIPADPPEPEPAPTPTQDEVQIFEDDEDQWV
jgi:hypothetical protein